MPPCGAKCIPTQLLGSSCFGRPGRHGSKPETSRGVVRGTGENGGEWRGMQQFLGPGCLPLGCFLPKNPNHRLGQRAYATRSTLWFFLFNLLPHLTSVTGRRLNRKGRVEALHCLEIEIDAGKCRTPNPTHPKQRREETEYSRGVSYRSKSVTLLRPHTHLGATHSRGSMAPEPQNRRKASEGSARRPIAGALLPSPSCRTAVPSRLRPGRCTRR